MQAIELRLSNVADGGKLPADVPPVDRPVRAGPARRRLLPLRRRATAAGAELHVAGAGQNGRRRRLVDRAARPSAVRPAHQRNLLLLPRGLAGAAPTGPAGGVLAG